MTLPAATARFRIVGLDPTPFQPLFELTDEALHARGMRRRFADEAPGFPCRVSLREAALGDELLLLTHRHFDVNSPYRSEGPIYVRRGVDAPTLAPGEVPEVVLRRLVSLRAYDAAGLMVQAEVCEGREAGAVLQRWFERDDVERVQLHNARAGCFSCEALRV